MAATALFHERGHDATSMSDIADRLGVTKAALYRHVRGRAEVLREVTRPVRARLRSLSSVSASGDGRSPAAELADVLDALALAAAADPARHAVFWGVGGTPSPDAEDAVCRESMIARLAQLLARAVHRGETRCDLDPSVTARLLVGAVVGTAAGGRGTEDPFGTRRDPDGESAAGRSPSAVDLLLDALLRSPAGPRRT
ncbi:TetR/AcrR family transcriptional regulator [Streptomyces sp. NBC_00525]|uniref:TetR/AcrR family transcriptional regulator n=1 Tax=Streptomyces sp. NBC_00525 TaxID=2903660 RepID=UPI002E81560B|nr:helix-turn-helix domain-containing protein [Streptomyces sp. NBC_00525]WUC96881.1 TetR/AcrR family transcriptional regulator [Streptomyces sp. NBC_00525]